jgi:hypothetical protein
MKDIIFFELENFTSLEKKDLKIFFKNLEIDNYDQQLYGLTPFRQRTILFLKIKDGKICYSRKKQFKQAKVSDKRAENREFKAYQLQDSDKPVLELFVNDVLRFLKKKFKTLSDLEFILHFVQINASTTGASNSPEGIHRDGFDILVPCFVVDRVNITGGASRAFIDNKIIYKKIIKPGQGLIINEGKNKDIFHDVEPIYLKDELKPGYRQIIGIDINFVK